MNEVYFSFFNYTNIVCIVIFIIINNILSIMFIGHLQIPFSMVSYDSTNFSYKSPAIILICFKGTAVFLLWSLNLVGRKCFILYLLFFVCIIFSKQFISPRNPDFLWYVAYLFYTTNTTHKRKHNKFLDTLLLVLTFVTSNRMFWDFIHQILPKKLIRISCANWL